MISESEALNSILEQVTPKGSGPCALADAIGHFAARDYRATLSLPAFDNSAMDGYAIAATDGRKGSRLRVTGEQPAGLDRKLKLNVGEAIRIFTGAPVPAGTGAVVMQEDVSRDGDFIMINEGIEAGEFIRRRGCDVAEGQELLNCGTKITPVLAGLLASQGIAQVEVGQAARVAVISTGDEVVPAGSSREAGQIFESNSVLLLGLLNQLGAKIESAVHCPDDRERVTEAIAAGAKADALIVTGGVSVGERDFVQEALRSAGGEISLWRVAIKPGKPFLFGRVGGCLIFGLPGNPVSAFVTFLKLVRPALLKVAGANDRELKLRRFVARVAEDLENSGDRAHYFRGRYEVGTFSPVGRQESHALFGLSQCNALLRVEAGGRVKAGSAMEVEIWE